MVAVVVAAGYALWSNHVVVQETLAELSWVDWLPSLLALPVAILLSTWSWQLLVDELGEPIGVARGAQIFLVGQLGKYLPGSVWAYVLQIELGRRAGLARARIFTATLFSLAVAVVAALLAGSLVLPGFVRDYDALRGLVWLYLLLPIGLVCLHPRILQRLVGIGFTILRRPQPRPSRPRAGRRAVALRGAARRTASSGCTCGCSSAGSLRAGTSPACSLRSARWPSR